MRRKKMEGMAVDPNLEEVGDNRGIGMFVNPDTKEVIFACHYRRKWGDQFDADIDHVYSLDEIKQMTITLLGFIEILSTVEVPEKATPVPIEGNPAQGPQEYKGA